MFRPCPPARQVRRPTTRVLAASALALALLLAACSSDGGSDAEATTTTKARSRSTSTTRPMTTSSTAAPDPAALGKVASEIDSIDTSDFCPALQAYGSVVAAAITAQGPGALQDPKVEAALRSFVERMADSAPKEIRDDWKVVVGTIGKDSTSYTSAEQKANEAVSKWVSKNCKLDQPAG